MTRLQNVTFLKKEKSRSAKFRIQNVECKSSRITSLVQKERARNRIACSIKNSILIHRICITNLRAFHFTDVPAIVHYYERHCFDSASFFPA